MLRKDTRDEENRKPCCVGKILCVAEIVNPAAYSMIAFALFAKKKVIKFYVERKLKGT